MTSPKLTIGIIAGNEESMIVDCLKSASWADQILVVAANSTDRTVSLIQKFNPKIKIITTFDQYNKNFSKWRNIVYQNTKTDWLFYLDCDERITPKLKKDILKNITSDQPSAYYVVPRANYFLGFRVHYGGTYPDYVKRLYHRKYFQGYSGSLHEEPIVNGPLGYLNSDLIHYTHRNLSSMMDKSIDWTETSANLIFTSNHPPISWWRIIRMMLTKFTSRYFIESMWRDGVVGLVSSVFETFDTYMIYSRVYELQINSIRD